MYIYIYTHINYIYISHIYITYIYHIYIYISLISCIDIVYIYKMQSIIHHIHQNHLDISNVFCQIVGTCLQHVGPPTDAPFLLTVTGVI